MREKGMYEMKMHGTITFYRYMPVCMRSTYTKSIRACPESGCMIQ